MRMKVDIHETEMMMYYKATKINPVDAGSESQLQYGIRLVSALPFPEQFITEAKTIRQELKQIEESQARANGTRARLLRKKLVLELHETLKYIGRMYKSNEMDIETVRNLLIQLQRRFIKSMHEVDDQP